MGPVVGDEVRDGGAMDTTLTSLNEREDTELVSREGM